MNQQVGSSPEGIRFIRLAQRYHIQLAVASEDRLIAWAISVKALQCYFSFAANLKVVRTTFTFNIRLAFKIN